MDPTDFPELIAISENNSARYFIMRAFKPANDPLFMHLYKVEEMFEGKPMMLESLIFDLLKKGQDQQAKGIWLRNEGEFNDTRFDNLRE